VIREREWVDRWSAFRHGDEEQRLFLDWVWPNDLETFRGKRVLDAGCGGGEHATLVASVAREVVAADLNTSSLVRGRLADLGNVEVREADLLTVSPEDLGGPFDVVYSVGVLHHTDEPDRAFSNLVRHVKPGGAIIAWVYSAEGNSVARWLVEPARKLVLRKLSSRAVLGVSWGLTVPALAAMHTVYRLPLRSALPLYDYLRFQRTLSASRVASNVYDKLIAPQTDFISRSRVEGWLVRDDLTAGHVSPYLGVSWRVSARKR